MNRYGWGTMMGDYTYLEEVGRQVGEWGVGIGKMRRGGRDDGEDEEEQQASYGGPDVAPNGLPTAYGHGLAPLKSKLEVLQRQLALRDIKVDILPEGMKKRKANQSFWNAKSKIAMLDVEFVLHAPKVSLSKSSDPNDSKPKTFTLVGRRKDIKRPLDDILQETLSQRNSKEIPEWVHDLLLGVISVGTSKEAGNDQPEDVDMAEPSDVLFLLPKHPPQPPRKWFHSLQRDISLEKLLRHKRFIEWPTIHVYLRDEFDGDIVGQEPEVHELPSLPIKRRRVDVAGGKRILTGLIGDYASESDESAGDELEPVKAAGVTLAQAIAYESDEESDSMRSDGGDATHGAAEMDEDHDAAWDEADGEIEEDEKLLESLAAGVIPASIQL
ncbi:hypothetical protein FRB99_003417 [Tulasnella sp. 403]|nr:hypothetical protein FRB99_003417 [Tulasnella sp. 403]